MGLKAILNACWRWLYGAHPTGEFDAATVESWQQAGAQAGWYVTESFGGNWWFADTMLKHYRGLPAFKYRDAKKGFASGLPKPTCPFGLVLSKCHDGALAGLAPMPQLQALHLASTPTTDAGIAPIARLDSLRILDLYQTNVTDAGMQEVVELAHLEDLSLGFTAVTNAGLQKICTLANLKGLGLFSTKVTDAGLVCLSLADDDVSDRSMEILAELGDIRSLHLDGTHLTDVGLEVLSRLRNLAELTLAGTEITDDGLRMLQKMPGLKYIDIDGCEVSNDVVADLRTTRQDLEVFFPDSDPERDEIWKSFMQNCRKEM
jgi:hypothetical protein